ncbi:cation transporter [Nitratireductor soli]|uniref:cation transporter n=1 Tax=Nitratireductor soli TaxID=1670619 RepID=UPI0009E38E3E
MFNCDIDSFEATQAAKGEHAPPAPARKEIGMARVLSTSSAGERLGFRIDGMDCASCVGKIETALDRLGGISEVSVNFANETLSLSRDPSSKTTEKASPGRSVRWDLMSRCYRHPPFLPRQPRARAPTPGTTTAAALAIMATITSMITRHMLPPQALLQAPRPTFRCGSMAWIARAASARSRRHWPASATSRMCG